MKIQALSFFRDGGHVDRDEIPTSAIANKSAMPRANAISSMAVIPAKAGIHFYGGIRATWIPAFAGMTALP
jgi:hypothetical protein